MLRLSASDYNSRNGTRAYAKYIRTHDVNMHRTDKPAINNVVLKDLSKSEIEKFFDVVVKSFKREDSVLPR
jgi:hypothetical protein